MRNSSKEMKKLSCATGENERHLCFSSQEPGEKYRGEREELNKEKNHLETASYWDN